MIKAVIVGTAHMHVNEIALYIQGEENSVLLGVSDVAPDEAENTDKRYTREWNYKNLVENLGVKGYENYIEMLDEVKPDVCFVLVENAKKVKIVEEIAKRKIDVIIEKPMAITSADADEILSIQKKYGVNIFVNWPVTWRKYVREWKATIDSGKYGTLSKVRYINGHTGPLGKGAKHRGVTQKAEEMTDEERGRTWWYKSSQGGGAFADILCYGCFFARWAFNKLPSTISAIGKNLNTPYGDVEDNVTAIMDFDGGFAVAEGTWTTPRKRMTTGPEAVLTDGDVWCDGVPDESAFISALDVYGNEGETVKLSEDESFKNMPCQYAAFKLKGQPMHETLTLSFNRDIASMIESAVKSNESGKAEKIK